MNAALPEEVVDQLAKSSRRAAVLSLIGFLVVLGAIGYAVFQLRTLERQRVTMQEQLVSLSAETQRTQEALATAQRDLTTARASLAAARAAINAFHAGRLADAVDLYDEALAADPDNAYLQNLRAYALFRLGRLDAAIEGQQRSLKADPDYAWGYFDLARFLCAASPSRLDEAQQAAAKAIELRSEMKEIMQRDGEFQRVCRGRLP